jgi:hypothetical protein
LLLGLYALGLHVLLIPFGKRMMIRSNKEAGLVARYRLRMFIGVGHSVIGEFIAIIFTFLGARFMVIPVGAAVAMTGLWRIAPTQRLFHWCDERLQAQGTPMRMTEAWRHLLTDPSPPPLPSARP